MSLSVVEPSCGFCDSKKKVVDMISNVYVPCPRCCPPPDLHLGVEIESGILQAERMEGKAQELVETFKVGTSVSRRLKIAQSHAKAMAGALKLALKELGVPQN